MKKKIEEHTPPYGLGGVVLDVAVEPIEDAQECDHKGHYRVTSAAYVAIRYCANCGQGWRMPTQGDYTGDHGGSFPTAEWEPIKEGLEVEARVLPDYEE